MTDIIFGAFYTLGGTGVTGLTVTVDVVSIALATGTETSEVSSASMTESGNIDGFYSYRIAGADLEGNVYFARATTSGVVDQADMTAFYDAYWLNTVLDSNAPSNAQTGFEWVRLMASSMLGKTAAGSTGWVARDLGDTKNRITGTLDEQGYRTAVTLDGS